MHRNDVAQWWKSERRWLAVRGESSQAYIGDLEGVLEAVGETFSYKDCDANVLFKPELQDRPELLLARLGGMGCVLRCLHPLGVEVWDCSGASRPRRLD